MTLPTVVAFFLQLTGGVALQAALDGFFMALHGQIDITRTVTKSALCQARQKLKASAFSALNQLWVEGWHDAADFARWNGLRVVAADGTCVRVPRWPENIDSFGWGPCNDGSVVMARCVALFSTACKQFLQVTVGRYDEGERALLVRSLGVLKRDDVLVLDRGYPAWWLFAALKAKGVAFCMRIDGCNWRITQQLMRSSHHEQVVSHRLSTAECTELQAIGLEPPSSVEVRFIKVHLPNGKIEVLVTSLLDAQRYALSSFGALYGKRWAIEEAFKTIKQRLHLEGLSGELPLAIAQEIQAKALMYNITQALCAEAQECVPEHQREHWQVNHAYALKHLGRVIICWAKGIAEDLSQLTNSLVATLAQTLEKIRPDRHFPRNHAVGGAQRPRRAYR